ncbi:GNAT family N-acetyltransferase [Hanstruepera marina]|uniref:GNAT family N-acetyltransferase n=1 Tax=Hanstruepera marina TaxID=2873265 RepID=UPI001CA72F73|nr:GNAT family N-acetyltransferase [Hanstruepera marina]
MDIEIRQATVADVPEITMLFRDTVREVNSKHYSEKQVQTWSTGANDTQKWEERINKLYFLVAVNQDTIVGFAYLKNGNYFDGLFVHKDFQRQGIASKLLRIIESKVIMDGFDEIKSDVSITALPFFEDHYYDVVKKQKKVLKGVIFENYIVSKAL